MENTNVIIGSELAMPLPIKLALGAYIVLFNVAVLSALLRVWPVPLTGVHSSYLSMEGQYLTSAALAGALGSYIHIATSFVDYAGRRKLTLSWGWWYVLRPFIGAALATVVYFLIRAGLISGAGEHATDSLNPYGIAAIAALSGMFSKQATDKLREVFQQFCAPNAANALADQSPQLPPPR
jgi:hypothetical protein